MKEALSVEDTLKLALEALETWQHFDEEDEQTHEAITAIKAALEAHKALMSVPDGSQPEQSTTCGEPDDLTIAYMSGYHDGKKAQPKEPQQEPACCTGNCPNKKECNDAMHCLYTTPPQRKPLTDKEIILIVAECAASHQHTDIHFARAIEAAHGIGCETTLVKE